MGDSSRGYPVRPIFYFGIYLLFLVSCHTIKPIDNEIPAGYTAADITPEEISRHLPQSKKKLQSLKGKGKALVSTPEQSDRVTLRFAGNRDTSRISIQNRLGIKGGRFMATGDSILIYNQIDKEAHKISYKEAHATQISSLASTNLVEIFNYRIRPSRIKKVLANSQYYLLIMVDNTKIRVDRNNYHIKEVQIPTGSKKPYNRIQYEGYKKMNGFQLPRKVTITSADRHSRVTLLVQSLSVNPKHLKLSLDIPNNITIQRL